MPVSNLVQNNIFFNPKKDNKIILAVPYKYSHGLLKDLITMKPTTKQNSITIPARSKKVEPELNTGLFL